MSVATRTAERVPARRTFGQTREVSFPVCAAGPWSLGFEAQLTGTVGGRFVSIKTSEPTYRPDPSACR